MSAHDSESENQEPYSSIREAEIDEIGKLETSKPAVRSSKVNSVEEIDSEREGIYNSEVGEVGYINSGHTAIMDSEVGEAGDITSERGAIVDSEVGEAGDITSSNHAIRESEIDSIGDIDSGNHGIARSEVGEAGNIKAEGDGVEGSIVDKVGDIKADRDGVDSDYDGIPSVVGEIGHIDANRGIMDSEVDSVQSINAEGEAISNSEVHHVGLIDSDHRGISQSKVGSVEIIKSQKTAIRNSEVNEVEEVHTDSDGVLKSQVRELNTIESGRTAIKDSEIETVGDIESKSAAVSSSEVSTIDGDILAGDVAFLDSEVNRIHGDIISQDFMQVEGYLEDPKNNRLPSWGKWTNKEQWLGGEEEKRYEVFRETDMPYAVADKILGGELDHESYGGFVAARDIDIEEFNDNMFVITPDSDDQFVEYNGEWDEFTQFLKNNNSRMEGISVFTPDVDAVEGIDHLVELENHYSDLLDDFTTEELRDNLKYVKQFSDILGDEEFLEMLEKARDTMETSEKEKVKEFGNVFSKLPEDLQQDFISKLERRKNSHIGKDLFNMARKRKYGEFVEGEHHEIAKLMDGGNSVIEKLSDISKPSGEFESERLRELPGELWRDREIPELLGDWLKDQYLSMRDGRLQGLMQKIGPKGKYGDLPEIDEQVFEEDSPYRNLLEDAISEFDDEISFLTHLAEWSGEQYQPDFDLKSKEGRRQHDPSFNPEENEDFESLWEHVLKEAEKDISNKERAYLIRSVKNLGKRIAKQEYDEITSGETQKEEFTEEEIVALHAHSRYNKNSDLVEKILDPEIEADQLEENREWLENNNFEYEELAEYEQETYDVESSRTLEQTIQSKKEDLLEEMADLINEIGDYENIRERVDQASSQEEKEEIYAQINAKENELERPSSTEGQEVYDELFDEKTNEWVAIEDQVEGVPDEIKIRPASPIEAMQMGSHFTNSCLAIGKGNGWSAAANALDANKQVLYAEDEDGEVIGRVLTAVTEDNRLEDYKVYNNSNADIQEPFEEYVESFAQELGLERVPEDEKALNVETLVAEDWYSAAIY